MMPIELMVEEQDGTRYCVRWSDDVLLLADVPESWLDLIGYMVARKLVWQGYNVDRLLVVRLRGSDKDLLRAQLGVAAATPSLNFANPVTGPTRSIYKKKGWPAL